MMLYVYMYHYDTIVQNFTLFIDSIVFKISAILNLSVIKLDYVVYHNDPMD